MLDLNRRHFEEAREMYADLWLGFTELETEAPHFETVLGTGEKRTYYPPGLYAEITRFVARCPPARLLLSSLPKAIPTVP